MLSCLSLGPEAINCKVTCCEQRTGTVAEPKWGDPEEEEGDKRGWRGGKGRQAWQVQRCSGGASGWKFYNLIAHFHSLSGDNCSM